jgi:hypothetical protein
MALGQSFNVDLNAAAGAGAGVPAATFGAAAGQAGVWNDAPTGAAAAVPLVDLTGAATASTLTRGAGIFSFAFNNPNTSGDVQALLDDIDCPAAFPYTYTFTGLAAGGYTVYTYAFEPCGSPALLTNVAVTGSVDPLQTVGGVMTIPDTFILGLTHGVHNVCVGAGGTIDIVITLPPGSSFGSINGFQVVYRGSGYSLTYQQPGGVMADLHIVNLCGGPGATYLNAMSFVAGGFPTGLFFGIDISLPLLLTEIAFGPPFYGFLDASGNANFVLLAPVPSGIPIFSVGLTLGPGGTIIATAPIFYMTL